MILQFFKFISGLIIFCMMTSQLVIAQSSLSSLPEGEKPLLLKANFDLHDINDINDGDESFEFTGVLSLTWNDKRQSFNPSVEGVSEKIFQGDYQFNEVFSGWFPQVILLNKSGFYETSGTFITVKPDGTVTLSQIINAVAEVDLSMRRYPFDRHKLEAHFGILGFDNKQVKFQVESKNLSKLDHNLLIAQWSLNGISFHVKNRDSKYLGNQSQSSTFILAVEVERQSLFILRLVIIPLAIIVMLSWCVFWMDRSSLGDRINVSFVGILTAVAYQIVVGDLLPHISYVTFMNGFLNISFLMMSATVVINLIVGVYDKKGKSKAGDLLDYRCRWIFPIVYFSLLVAAYLVAIILF